MDSLLGFARRHPNVTLLLLGAVAALGYPPLGLWPVALAAMGAFALIVADSPSIGIAAKRDRRCLERADANLRTCDFHVSVS